MDASERLIKQIEDIARKGANVKFTMLNNNLILSIMKMYDGEHKYSPSKTICLDIKEYRDNLTENVIDRLTILEIALTEQDKHHKKWIHDGRPRRKELAL